MPACGPAGALGGSSPERSELVEGEDPVGEAVKDLLDSVQLRLTLGSGSGNSFHVLVRWKVTPWRASRPRNASRPMRIIRPWTFRR
jgi:hypothetical protein